MQVLLYNATCNEAMEGEWLVLKQRYGFKVLKGNVMARVCLTCKRTKSPRSFWRTTGCVLLPELTSVVLDYLEPRKCMCREQRWQAGDQIACWQNNEATRRHVYTTRGAENVRC